MKDKEKSPKRIVFNITPEDEKLMTKYQLIKLEETGEKPSYNEIVNEVTDFSIEKFRDMLQQIVDKHK